MSGTKRAKRSHDDARFMGLAIAEAAKGLGRTHPNPAVGAVLVKSGKVIARGFHAMAGTPHAEVVALSKAGPRARGATLYSTLEPCDHWGKTPPCTQAIIEAGVSRLVFASSDPNPLVNGKGVARLEENAVGVTAHVLRAEADALNLPFFKFMRTGLPWVTLKAAISLDGKLATATGDSKWITGEAARLRAHRLRDRVDAIVVGAGTVVADDPLLTTRLPHGGRNAVRVVLDSRLRTSARAKLYRTGQGLRTIVATTRPVTDSKARSLMKRGVEVWHLRAKRGRVELKGLLERLGQAGLLHVMVEGGASLHGSFLREGLVDDLALFVAPRIIGHEGLTWSGELAVKQVAKALELELASVEQIGTDLLITARAG